MSGLYLRRPIINRDTADNEGVRAEVRVTYGCGIVEEVTDKKRNARVVINTGTTYTQGSFLLIKSDIYPMVKESLETQKPIIFRIETIRKDGIDRTIGIEELIEQPDNNKRIVKQLTAAKWEEEDSWVIADNIYTLIEDDFISPPNPYKIKKQKSNKDNGILKEGMPWEDTNVDGSINLGSNLMMATIGSLNLARTALTEAGIDYKDKELFILGSALFKLCNRMQKKAFAETGSEIKPSVSYNSNTRARGLIHSEIEHNKLTEEVFKDKDKLKAWLEEIEDGAFLMWRIAIKIGKSAL